MQSAFSRASVESELNARHVLLRMRLDGENCHRRRREVPRIERSVLLKALFTHRNAFTATLQFPLMRYGGVMQ